MAKKKKSRNRLPRGMDVLYEDSDLLVVNKPAGLLTVKTATQKTQTAFAFMTDYVKKGQSKSRKQVYTVHRLDQWTSGVLIFAKSEAVKDCLKGRWDETKKTYLAVVHGRLKAKEGTISSYLAEGAHHAVYSTTDRTKGKLSHTAYKVLKETPRYSLLEIDLLTGRKNQIRVHLSDQGHPIVGDRKYGKKTDGVDRLSLHAKAISFPHPTRDEIITVEAETPDCFRKLVGAI